MTNVVDFSNLKKVRLDSIEIALRNVQDITVYVPMLLYSIRATLKELQYWPISEFIKPENMNELLDMVDDANALLSKVMNIKEKTS